MKNATLALLPAQGQSAVLEEGRRILWMLDHPPEVVVDLDEIRDRLKWAIDAKDDPLVDGTIREAKVALGLICPSCGDELAEPIEGDYCSGDCYRRNGIDDGGAL